MRSYSITLTYLVLPQAQVARRNRLTYARNRAYYIRKWGGDGGQETYTRPFNDPRFTRFIDPRVREAPYWGLNRNDHEILRIYPAMANLLVTGGLGFIGGHLVRELLKDPSAHVTVVDKRFAQHPNRTTHSPVAHLVFE